MLIFSTSVSGLDLGSLQSIHLGSNHLSWIPSPSMGGRNPNFCEDKALGTGCYRPKMHLRNKSRFYQDPRATKCPPKPQYVQRVQGQSLPLLCLSICCKCPFKYDRAPEHTCMLLPKRQTFTQHCPDPFRLNQNPNLNRISPHVVSRFLFFSYGN